MTLDPNERIVFLWLPRRVYVAVRSNESTDMVRRWRWLRFVVRGLYGFGYLYSERER